MSDNKHKSGVNMWNKQQTGIENLENGQDIISENSRVNTSDNTQRVELRVG